MDFGVGELIFVRLSDVRTRIAGDMFLAVWCRLTRYVPRVS